MEIKIYTDGGSLGNPGPAAIAFVVYQDNKIIFQYSQTIGKATNNFAEYTALVKALEWLKNYLHTNSFSPHSRVKFYSDSNLLINQITGYFKVKNANIGNFILKIRSLENQINASLVYYYIPRWKNQLADSLVKKALKTYNNKNLTLNI